MEIDNEVQMTINEMGKVFDIVKPIGVYIYSNDHTPPHVHLGLKNGAAIRIAIPNTPFETQEQVKNLVLGSDKELISAYQKYFADFIRLMKEPPRSKVVNAKTNLEYAQDSWVFLHDEDDADPVFTDVNAVIKKI